MIAEFERARLGMAGMAVTLLSLWMRAVEISTAGLLWVIITAGYEL